jgi:hypothetical protein
MNFLKASEKGIWRFGSSGRRSLTCAIVALGRSLDLSLSLSKAPSAD